jgi:hypothetical protein
MTIKLSWPISKTSPITQRWGENPGSGYVCMPDGSHNGVDFGVPEGTAIYAAAEGQVTHADMDNTGYGLHVRIQHDGFMTLYGHLRALSVSRGQRVTAGQRIGESGNTGRSTGPHLHFEVRKVASNCQSTIDPLLYLTTQAKYRGVVTDAGNGLRIRSKPDTTGEIRGYLYSGQVIDLVELRGEWAKLLDAGERWVCIRLGGETYVQVTPAGDAPVEQPKPAPTWEQAVDTFLRGLGYNGPKPENR